MLIVLMMACASCAAVGNAAEPRAGQVDLLVIKHSSSTRTTDGSSSSSSGTDTVLERVIASTDQGVVLEYAAPPPAAGEEADANWELPARLLKPDDGAAVLLNRGEMEARLDGWLAAAGWTRDVCGRLIFTWNAFRIQCDPEVVPAGLRRFDPGAEFPGPGGLLTLPNALGSAVLEQATVKQGRTRHTAVLPVDADAVRHERATTDVGVAEITGEELSLDDALAARAGEQVTGSVTVTFDVDATGIVRRRRDETALTIQRPDGVVETQVDRVDVERRTETPGAVTRSPPREPVEGIRTGTPAT